MKKFLMPSGLLLLGMVLILVFNLIGSHVSLTGEVIEPFFLLPLGGLMIFIGVVWMVIAVVFAWIKLKFSCF